MHQIKPYCISSTVDFSPHSQVWPFGIASTNTVVLSCGQMRRYKNDFISSSPHPSECSLQSSKHKKGGFCWEKNKYSSLKAELQGLLAACRYPCSVNPVLTQPDNQTEFPFHFIFYFIQPDIVFMLATLCLGLDVILFCDSCHCSDLSILPMSSTFGRCSNDYEDLFHNLYSCMLISFFCHHRYRRLTSPPLQSKEKTSINKHNTRPILISEGMRYVSCDSEV